GSGSLSETAVRVVLPVLLAVIVKPIWLPATTLTASAVFTRLRPGFVTQMPSRSVFVVLPVVTVAVLSRLALWPLTWIVQFGSGLAPPPAGAVVGLVTCTDAEAPAARSPNEHERFRPLTWQVPAGLLEATLQVMPMPAIVGRGSLRVTLVRVVLP